MRSVAALLLSLPFAACAAAPPPAVIEIDRDDIVIRGDTLVRPGHYRVADANGDGVLHVVGDGIVVVLDGVTLDGSAPGAAPDAFAGIGIRIAGGSRVRITGGAVRGFRVGLGAERVPGLEVVGLDVSDNRAMRLHSTPRREHAGDWLWPHDNDAGEWQARYGAGIALTDCSRALVLRCRARGTQNGLLLTRCRDARVLDNDFSFLSGWGIALYRSSGCRIEHNRCDFCVRGYSHGVYARGQDSAGILLFEQCCDNVIAHNSATHGGDGLFLYAGHETTQRTGAGGSNRNRVVGNDFSYAVANGIEATFSRDNAFVDNCLDGCDHGVWAGYSSATEIRGNSIRGAAHGISIEHGQDNRIVGNELVDCGIGVHLWWDDDTELLASAFGRRNDTASARTTVHGNWITGGGTALRLDGDTGSRIVGNRIDGAALGLDARGRTAPAAFADNAVAAATAVRCATEAPLRLGANAWQPWHKDGPQQVLGAAALPALPVVPRPVVAGGRDAAPGPGGRERIVVGEWGPLDPAQPALLPLGAGEGGDLQLRVLGQGLPFRVEANTAGVTVEPAAGTAPATLTVRLAAAAPAVLPWSAAVRIGERACTASGTWTSTAWNVRFWRWQCDPRDDAAAWQALLATPPLATVTTAALDFDWGGAAPAANVPADHFATVAETTLELPAGRWRLVTVSDDGIRVSVDGEAVLTDWTWHAPRELACERTLGAGPHTIRVEHFELDGHAALACRLEPVPE
ncbi:MAG: right-handed parallel beta-helix repeat-containing protein [Planctomycetes bacterium]|nr:right-handed parallel beta-helix repeat-containing protein [Planctomycetota bacterium]